MSAYWKVGLGLALLTAGAAQAAAQQEAVGRFDRIVSLDAGIRRIIRQPTPLATLQPAGGAPAVALTPAASLYDGQRLRVARYLDARLRVDWRGNRGAISFLPELWQKGGGQAYSVAGPAGRVAEGRYQVSTGGQAGSGVMVTIESGAIAVDWKSGTVRVTAAGTALLVTGTQLAVVVDSMGTTGDLYLAEGTVTFPDYPTVQVKRGQWAHLRPGLPPVVTTLAPALASLAAATVRYHVREVWQTRALLLRPVVLGPAVAVVGGVAAAVLGGSGGGGGGGGTHTGGVGVRLPSGD
jgi:hypothetical protein